MNTLQEVRVMPSTGDSVLLYLNGQLPSTPAPMKSNSHEPFAATVAFVWGPAMVNLSVIDHNGNRHALTSVPFHQPGEDSPAVGMYCELSCILGELLEGEPVPAYDFGTEGIVASSPERPHSFGEKAVGLSFNPSNETDVYKAKTEAAALIDRAHQLRQNIDNFEVQRMAALAITATQEAQMWLVKAQTWKD